MLMYAWNELDEGGGGIVPTNQEGTMYLDALEAVRSGYYPPVFKDVYNGDNCSVQLTGSSWVAYPMPSIPGIYNGDDEISGVNGEQMSLTTDSTVNFEVKGILGPNRGKMAVYIDGQFQANVNLNNPNNYVRSQSLYKSTILLDPTIPHTLKLVNTSDTSGQMQMGIDAIVVTKVWNALFQTTYSGDSPSIQKTGTQWVDWQNADGTKEEISTANNQTMTLATTNTSQFLVRGTTGPNRGHMLVSIDGTPVQWVNLNNTSWAVNQLLFAGEDMLNPKVSHTLQLEDLSNDPNAMQMGVQSIVTVSAPYASIFNNAPFNVCVDAQETNCHAWNITPGYYNQ